MDHIAVRALRDHLSAVLRRVAAGERVLVTDRGNPIATLAPVEESEETRLALRMVAEGRASWNGAKPRGANPRPRARARGKATSALVLEDRR